MQRGEVDFAKRNGEINEVLALKTSQLIVFLNLDWIRDGK